MKENRHHSSAPKYVGVWIRVSTEEQAEGQSPKHHELRAREYAKSRGWEIREVYDLAGVSGKTVMEHPEAQRMLADIRRGHISGLLFSKLARLARNTRELLDFCDIFRDANADLISIGENIDTSTPMGRLFFTFTAAVATWEREEIVERIRASVKVRAKLGKPLSGRVAYGYHFTDGKIVPHPNESPVRALIYELFAKHKRKKTVARLLNERGFRTRDGKTRKDTKFTDTTIERLIRDTTAKGEHRANFSKRVADNKPWTRKPEHEWVITPVPAIVSAELWEECNALLDARRTKRERPSKKVVHPFAGLVFCTCGRKMYVPSSTPKYVCTVCHTKMPVIDLDGAFHDELASLVEPTRISSYVSGAEQELRGKCQLLETVDREQARLKAEIEKLYQLFNDSALTSEQFKIRFQPIEERRTQIEQERPKIEGEIAALKSNTISQEHLASEGGIFHARWPTMSVEEKREVVELMVKNIVIADTELKINYCYAPLSKELPEKQRTL
jgi:site-specific DNA recombinase